MVTDAIAALGMGEGEHKLGGVNVKVVGLKAVVEGTNTTAGRCVLLPLRKSRVGFRRFAWYLSVASIPYCISHLVKAARCPLEEALVCATEKPGGN